MADQRFNQPGCHLNHQSCSDQKAEISLDENELKELFTDPALRDESVKSRNKRRRRSSDSISSDDTEAVGIAKLPDPLLNLPGRHLITRRITIAGGFLDIALFSANCEQLKFVLELGQFHIYYNQVLGLIITSLVLQLLVGLTMFLLGCHVIRKASDESYSNFLNHVTMGLVALITIVNIFIGTFGPKGTVMAKCLGAFSYPNSSGPLWLAYLNLTRNFMSSEP